MEIIANEQEDLRSIPLPQLREELMAAGFPAFRASQVYRWLHVQQVADYEGMTNLPGQLKEYLAQHYRLASARMIDRQISQLDGTQKFLFAMQDDAMVESVFMQYHYGNSVCISSQVGCRMGCRFCASTLDGLVRNLLPGEMLEQIYQIHRLTGEKISHVVVMGTGEPLDNYENLVTFLRLLTGPDGPNLSMRNVTVSTCGIVPGIRRLAKEKLGITLALSLHAATDEQRREIMPVAYQWSIRELMDACLFYLQETGRRITFEYSLIAGVNDSAEDAKRLSTLAGEVGAHINLIPVNPVRERKFHQPTADHVRAFQQKLESYGANVSIRRVLGRDIDGACGQLRHRHLDELKSDQGDLAEMKSKVQG